MSFFAFFVFFAISTFFLADWAIAQAKCSITRQLTVTMSIRGSAKQTPRGWFPKQTILPFLWFLCLPLRQKKLKLFASRHCMHLGREAQDAAFSQHPSMRRYTNLAARCPHLCCLFPLLGPEPSFTLVLINSRSGWPTTAPTPYTLWVGFQGCHRPRGLLLSDPQLRRPRPVGAQRGLHLLAPLRHACPVRRGPAGKGGGHQQMGQREWTPYACSFFN